MSRLREIREEPAGKNRREFCRLGGNVIVGMTVLTSLPGMSSGMDLHARNASIVDVSSETRELDMEEKKVTSVTAKVISVKGECGLGHKVGDTIRISESGVEGKICIHALYSMFPAAFAMLYDAKFPWLKDPDKKTHPCTDAANPVVFELTKIRA